MNATKSIQDVLNPQHPIVVIHGYFEDMDVFNGVLGIIEYGFRRFFQDYRVFLGCSYRKTLADMYWNDAFEAFISQPYCQLWMGLDTPPKQKKRATKYEWYDNLVLGENY